MGGTSVLPLFSLMLAAVTLLLTHLHFFPSVANSCKWIAFSCAFLPGFALFFKYPGRMASLAQFDPRLATTGPFSSFFPKSRQLFGSAFFPFFLISSLGQCRSSSRPICASFFQFVDHTLTWPSLLDFSFKGLDFIGLPLRENGNSLQLLD